MGHDPNAAQYAHIFFIDMDKLDRGDSDASSFENVELEGDIVKMVVLWAGAGLHLAQSPGSGCETFEHALAA